MRQLTSTSDSGKFKVTGYSYGNARAAWDHIVLHLPPDRGDIPAFTPAKLVLDLATPEGCKAELT